MIYFDNAATTFPKPKEVCDEVLKCMTSYAANPGRGSHDMALRAELKILETRQLLAAMFNIDEPFSIAFTSNATQGLNLAIMNLLRKGDHVITTVIEHNSVLRPINHKKNQGVQVTFLKVDKNGYIDVEELKKSIRKNTKCIIINHASNVLGTVQDIDSIGKVAKEKGIIFMVDASQSAGTIKIDVKKSNIDILVFPGHKGLLGPQGIGGIYINSNIQILNGTNIGGTGSNSHLLDQPDFMPDKFESGTLNMPGIAGLNEGIKFINKIGIDNISKKEKEIVDFLIKELSKKKYVKIYAKHGNKLRSAVLSINIEGIDSSEIGERLNGMEIAVRTGYHCAPLIHEYIDTSLKGTVRLSPGYFNTIEEAEKVIDALIKIYKS